MNDPAKHYDPKSVEDKWYARWEAEGAFHGDPARGGTPYAIVIPPPNVTGILHMGHALNNSLQDVLIRWHRMRGFNATWVPGTDHAGIATQNVVEKALKKEGLRRQDLGREKFLERVWAWNDQYGKTITRQLRKLGCACDWEREAFTMSPALSAAVREVFVRLYDKGLIYRGNYIINWCPRCLTALSDEESEPKATQGRFYHIRYPVKGGRKNEHVVVATTRPETLLGDVAVAVNPRDERHRALLQRTLLLPLLGRELRVIADDFVDPAFGTGLVKVTPAHDPNDFQMGLRHGLEQINVMTPDGKINEAGGPYAGLDRFEARKRIVADLEAQGLIEKIEDHAHNVGHCYRCDTMVEPRLSLQWFVRMKPLARPGIEAVRAGRISFTPERWTKVYLDWMENIRDWCISRQIWWGHRIPVFYCDGCGHQWADRADPAACPKCASASFRQDEDVLDTWFSSWLWPFSTFGWPASTPDLRFYYPTATLATASEILFFWVARMIMAGYEFMGDLPFREVYIHGTVRDTQGRKMSKSLGNSIDPLEIIQEFSADALRWSLIMLTATGQDVYIDRKKFEIGRNFCTKLWNASRFLLLHSPAAPADFADPALDPSRLSADDKHILHALQRAIANADDHLERYRFNDFAKELYEFTWHKYCDWYVEHAKQVFQGGDEARKEQVRKVMHHVFSTALRLLHPVMPFITEELWQQMGYAPLAPSIQRAPWPVARDAEALKAWDVRLEAVDYVDAKQDMIRAGRNLRADYNIQPGARVVFVLKPANPRLGAWVGGDTAAILPMLRAETLRVEETFSPAKAMPSVLTKLGTLYLPVEGVIDVAAESKRLGEQLAKMRDEIGRITLKLENTGFTAKAPAEVIDGFKARRGELLEKAEKLEQIIQGLT